MFGRSRRPVGEASAGSNGGRAGDRPANRRFARTPLILSLLLLLGAAAGVGWLHLTDRLQPLLATGPRIVVELPAAIPPAAEGDGDGASVEQAAEAPAGAPKAEVELAPDPSAEALPEEEMAAVRPDDGEPGPDGQPAPDGSEPDAEAGISADGPAASPQEGAEPQPSDAADEGAAAAPESPTAEATAEPTAEPPLPETAPPPPPAPPAPEIEAPEIAGGEDDSVGEGPADALQPGDPTAAADTETAGSPAPPPAEEAQPEAAEPPGGAADAEQLAAATVPPGVVPAWQRFARPFPADEPSPRIAIVVAGLGLSEAATTAAIQQLPGEITLSFSPYSNRIEEWMAMAQAAGHEVMIDLPMEPTSFPRDDPGPQALLTSLSAATNAERLEWILSRAEGYVGVASYMGSRFTTSSAHMRPVLEVLARRGLLFLDSRAAADSLAASLASTVGVPHAINDRFLDNEASRVAIDGRLQQIERIARTKDVAVAMGYAYPVTIERLTQWTKSLAGKGLALAPISAVVGLQEDR